MINRCFFVLVDELRAEGIADPLSRPFTLAALWDDLAAIAGEAPPTSVQEYLGGAASEPASTLGEHTPIAGETVGS